MIVIEQIEEAGFTGVYDDLRARMSVAPPVRQDRWQGIDVRKNPAARCYELSNVVFERDLCGVEDLDHWRRDIGPNLPWADDHFLERIGGEPLNPGEQWKNWPWGQSAARFRTEEFGPRLPCHDWAYLAGILDGDGCIYQKSRDGESFQGRVYVAQKDRAVLDYLHQLFLVGNVVPTSERSQELNQKVYENPMFEWQIGAILEIRWLLAGCLPYLKVKRSRAESVFASVCEALDRRSGAGAPLKKVWGRDWPARFNHSYPDRLWPSRLEGGSPVMGLERPNGDLDSLVDLLVRDPYTRQAYIPLFFPEDTGWGDGGRKPCTLGYQLIMRDNRLSIGYPLRSCDLIRHFRDDCYLAVRLLLWVLDRCRAVDQGTWGAVRPGTYTMHITSLHVFENDRRLL